VDALQLIGDGLLTAIGQKVDGASPLAAEWKGLWGLAAGWATRIWPRCCMHAWWRRRLVYSDP